MLCGRNDDTLPSFNLFRVYFVLLFIVQLLPFYFCFLFIANEYATSALPAIITAIKLYNNIIASKYSAKYDNYYYCDILGAFNVYFATRIILDKFDLKAQRLYAVSLEKEQENKSITYKTMHLLNALKYTAVMPALTNVIISTYIKQTSHTALYSDDFEKEFGHFIDGLIEDRNNDNINMS